MSTMKGGLVAAVAASVAAVVLTMHPLAAQSLPVRPRVPRIPRGPAGPPQGTPGATYRLRLTGERVAAIADAQVRGLGYVPGEVLVKFKPGVSPQGQQRALMALRSRPPVGALQWSGDVALLRDLSQPDARILADQLSEQPEVQYAEPNYLRRLPAKRSQHIAPALPASARVAFTPNDTDYGVLQWNFPLINMPGAWDINHGANANLVVAVVDTGITTADQTLTFPLWTGSSFDNVSVPFAVNPDLPASRLVSPTDFVFMDAGGPVLDMVGHATHVSSTIGESTNNMYALAGMAYNVKIMPVKVCVGYWEMMFAQAADGVPGFLPPDAGGCPDDAIAAGIRYAADNGAKIINLSLGGPGEDTTTRDAIAYAVSRGAFVSISMGNDYENGNPIDYPAGDAPGIDGAMSVAAVGKSMRRAYYSSTGSDCEIAAPGGDDRDPGAGEDFGYIWQATLYYPDQDPSLTIPRFDRYAEIGYEGTSMAAPHVAGMAALLMTQGVTSPAAIEHLIRQTARDLGAPGRDDEFGYGLIQPRTALFGFGIKR
jgi:serine protease